MAKAQAEAISNRLCPKAAAAQNLCGAPLFHLKAVILPKYMLSVCAMCTNKRANGCFLVDKSQKERYNRKVLNPRAFIYSSPW